MGKESSFKIIIMTELRAVLGQYELFTDQITRGHLVWTIELRFHARGVYLAQDTSRTETVRLNQE